MPKISTILLSILLAFPAWPSQAGDTVTLLNVSYDVRNGRLAP